MQNKNNKRDRLIRDLVYLTSNPANNTIIEAHAYADIYKMAKEEAEKVFSQWMVDDTKHYQNKYNFNSKEDDAAFSTHNNEADAFKHTYMQAWLTANIHESVAEKLGNMHENDGKGRNQPSGEENMDLWNNDKGREIGLEIKPLMKKYNIKKFTPEVCDLIAERVMQRMNAGQLITNPNDKRRYVPKNKSGNPTGYAAPVSSSVKLANQPVTKLEKSQTPSQNFSDIIRQKYKSQVDKTNKKFN